MRILRKGLMCGSGLLFGIALTMGAAAFGIADSWSGVLAASAGAAALLLVLALFGFALAGRSWALAGYFCLLVFLMDATLRARDLQDTSADWQSLAKLGLWAGALAIGLVHLPRTHRVLLRTPAVCLVLFGLWAMMTAVYSPVPTFTLGAALSFFGLVLFAPAVLDKVAPASLLMALAGTLTAFLALSWIVYGLAPELGTTTYYTAGGDMLRMSGLAGKPTNLGRLAATLLLCLFALVHMKRLDWKWAALPALMALATIFEAQTRTALAGALLAVGLLALRRRPGWLLLFAAGLSTAMYALSLTFFQIDLEQAAKPLARSGNVEEIFTFTGRTDIWKFVIGKIAESPWLGYGYGSSRVIISAGYASEWGFTTGSAHNTLLQSLLTTGIIGTSLVVFILARQVKQFFTDPEPFCDGMLVFLLVNAMMEALIVGAAPSVLTLVWLITVYWREKKHEATVRRLDPVYAQT